MSLTFTELEEPLRAGAAAVTVDGIAGDQWIREQLAKGWYVAITGSGPGTRTKLMSPMGIPLPKRLKHTPIIAYAAGLCPPIRALSIVTTN